MILRPRVVTSSIKKSKSPQISPSLIKSFIMIIMIMMIFNNYLNDEDKSFGMMKTILNFNYGGSIGVQGFVPVFNKSNPSTMQVNTRQISYSRNFNKCWNTSPIMTVDLNISVDRRAVLKNITSEIPDGFYCESVTLWDSYEISPYFITYLLASVFGVFTKGNGGDYELCGKVRAWEDRLKIQCESMLCDYKEDVDFLPDYISQVTNGETTIFDWMNYCKYCKEGNSTYSCNPKDDYSRFLIASFPNSALYCGTLEFGIPLVVNTSRVPKLISSSTHFNTELDFNFICYCLDSFEGYFSFKCSDNKNNYRVHLFTKLSVTILHGLTIIGLCIFLVIPKFVVNLRKSRYNHVLPSTSCLLGEVLKNMPS